MAVGQNAARVMDGGYGMHASASFGSPTLDQFCLNCDRDVNVDGESCNSELGVFCGKNCYWSFALDTANMRERIRAAAVNKNANAGRTDARAPRQSTRVTGKTNDAFQKHPSQDGMRPLTKETMDEHSNAIYHYQAFVVGTTTAAPQAEKSQGAGAWRKNSR
ncbi:hypothetical protein FVE85_4240 [Porphyridium purpureum]|uniref:Uncharacterized protein n=1 Tax=Porphyridium purpureum TaxID=35688 RepID=A0A5J4YSS2_PORPP|nr:hypothetical protein FVE85_4240 [Porphyridium purpureum]|eukprot:POR3657..scf229_5